MLERLFIRINENGTIEHPIFESNLRIAFPDFDPDNPPKGFVRFIRTPMPIFEDFRLVEKTTYELSEALTAEHGFPVYTDVHHIREMTDDEKNEKLSFIEVNKLPPNIPVVNISPFNIETQPYTIPPQPDNGNYEWNPHTRKWVDRDKIAKIYSPFFEKYNIPVLEFNYELLSDEQKAEFSTYVEEAKKLI